MTYFREADIDALIAGAGGEDVTVNAVTVKGLIDVADQEMFAGDMPGPTGKATTITVKTGALPALAPGVALTARSTSYRVHQVEQVEDGALTRALCMRA